VRSSQIARKSRDARFGPGTRLRPVEEEVVALEGRTLEAIGIRTAGTRAFLPDARQLKLDGEEWPTEQRFLSPGKPCFPANPLLLPGATL
jgi:hypothetical protein